MVDAQPSPSEPRLVDSVVRALEAGQRVVLDRVDLLRFDLRQQAGRTLSGALLVAVGAFLVAAAWVAGMGAVVVWLQQYLVLYASLAVVAAATAVVGAAAMAIGMRRGRTGTARDAGESVGVASAGTSGWRECSGHE